MAEQHVTAEAGIGAQRALKVHTVADGDAGQRGGVERDAHHVRGPGLAIGGRDGETDAVDRDGLAVNVVAVKGRANGERAVDPVAVTASTVPTVSTMPVNIRFLHQGER
ncbi:hypothetical protein GCM10025876_38480 [Demequina litorisediminis]|uniref:Uncharacterized protein n=1 Tax=Demequina litorisediminis TaxID=1849022 RepID=A0ABQ6IIC8_9MICO|nr:hypothetical protein GCM10025876_38480 [Demequina litorisediminis]